MKVSDLLNAREAIEKIARMEMDAAAALSFAKFTKEVLLVVQDFEKKRAELIKKYGEPDNQGNVRVKQENQKKFNSAMKRALNKKVDIEPFDIFSAGFEIAPSELINAIELFK